MNCLCIKCTNTSCERKKSLQKVKQGKKNRSTGRYAEDKLLKLLTKWNLDVHKTVASGQLKGVKVSKKQKYLFTSDFYCSGLVKHRIKIECKKRQYKLFKKYYEKVSVDNILYINDLCYVVHENTMSDIISGDWNLNNIVAEANKLNKGLENFFHQDNAQIVALISPNEDTNRYHPFLFCISPKVFNELKERGNN